MHSILRSALARIASFFPIAVATLLTSRLIIEHYSIGAFNAYALILSVIFLIPFDNLGVGGAVTSAYAERGPHDRWAWRVTLTAMRSLAVSTLATAVIALGLGWAGVWPTLLGSASGPSWYTGLAVALYALSFVPGLGADMLLGVHRNHVSVVLQSLFAPLLLLGVGATMLLDLSGSVLVLVPPLGMVVVALITAVVARRATRVSWGALWRALPRRRREPGARIRHLAAPIFLSAIATPLALQSDRIVLSHVSDATALAQYSVVMQIVAPATALIAATAQPLWPIFSGARARGERAPSIARTVGLFALLAAVAGAVLVAIADPLADLISGGRIPLGVLVPVSAALVVMAQAGSYPIAMNLMTPTGARFVAKLTLCGLPLNLALSIALAAAIGAAGPLLATAVVVLVVQTVPGLLYSRQHERPGRHRLEDVDAPSGGATFAAHSVAFDGAAPPPVA